MCKIFNNKIWFIALLLVVSMTGCGSDNGGGGGNSGPVNLGTSGDLAAAASYAILAKTAITTVPSSSVIGNIGLSPEMDYGAHLSTWSLTGAAEDPYFNSAQVPAPFHVYSAANTGGTTQADIGKAVLSMEAAYTDAAGRAHGVGPNLNLNGGTLNGQTLAPGTYTWDTPGNVHITGNFTLTGSATDVWIFQIKGTLAMDGATSVILAGNAQAKNIFWQVAGTVAIGADSHFEGIILGKTSISFGNKASINGRLLAQTLVALDMTTVTQP